MDPETRQVLQEYAAEIQRLNREVDSLKRGQRRPQLAHSSLEEGQSVEVRDDDGNVRTRIGWQPDGTAGLVTEGGDAPPAPTVPTVEPSMGGLRVTWDGLMANDQAKPADLGFVQVHVSTASGFVPDASTRAGSIPREGGIQPVTPLPYEQHHVKLVGVTTGGVQGDPSTEASATPVQVDGPDLVANSVTTAHIQAGAIEADQLAALIVLASRLVAGNDTGARVELNESGFRAYNGSEELTVDIDAADGSAVFTGTITGSLITGSEILFGDLQTYFLRLSEKQYSGGGETYYELEMASENDSNVSLAVDSTSARIGLRPPEGGGYTWEDALINTDFYSNGTEYWPALLVASPNHGVESYSSIELIGGGENHESTDIEYWADRHYFRRGARPSATDGVVELASTQSIQSVRHRYVKGEWLGTHPTGTTTGSFVDFTESEWEHITFKTSESGATRIVINAYGINANSSSSLLNIGFAVASFSASRARSAEIRTTSTSDPPRQQCSVVYLDLPPNTSYLLVPRWRLSSGSWGGTASLSTVGDNSIIVEPLS